MSREQVLDILKKYIEDTAADDVDVAELETSKSLRDLDINSLDTVDIISRSMRELKVKVPRAELARAESIDGVVDLLYQAVQSRAS